MFEVAGRYSPMHTVDSPVIRRRRSLQAKATFYVLVAVLFSSFDATAQQRRNGFSPNLHQQTSLPCYSSMLILT